MPGATYLEHLNWAYLPFAAGGAFLHWYLQRYQNFFNGLDRFMADISAPGLGTLIIKIVFFVSLGATVAVVFLAPVSIRQAVTAGMAWTTFFGHSIRPHEAVTNEQ